MKPRIIQLLLVSNVLGALTLSYSSHAGQRRQISCQDKILVEYVRGPGWDEIVETANGPDKKVFTVLARHFAYRDRLLAEGVLESAGGTFLDDTDSKGRPIFTGGVLLFAPLPGRSDAVAAAKERLEADPLVQSHVVTYRLVRWEECRPSSAT
jgi:hypothetical protein